MVKTENQVEDGIAIRENKLSLVERLADDLAHEIKNPLHSMVINLEVLRRRIARLESTPTEEMLRYVEILGSELDRVNRRVDLLLKMMRPHRDSDERTTLPEVLEELHELLRLECKRHEVTLHVHVPESMFRPLVPPAPAAQMVLTLVLSALDHLGPGATLHLRTEIEGDLARLAIRGVGADGSCGEPAHYSVEDDLPAAVKALAEQLGGRLEVDAEGGEEAGFGSVVLTLPRDP